MKLTGKLRELASGYGFELTERMLEQFQIYAALLDEWSQRMNLTAIREPDQVEIKHFLDSILLLRALELPQGARLIDVGAGAGFPSVPVKILRPDIRLTLLDSLQKRVGFLTALSGALEQQNTFLHARAERLSHDNRYREQYDLATARAVAALPALCEYCLPFVRIGGCFAALKGGDSAEEIASAGKALSLLGGSVDGVSGFTLPDGSARTIILIKKISQTSTKYPRTAVKITKSPL